MLYLEIQHPNRERMVLPLRDGVFFLPPSGLEENSLRWRLRMVVHENRVRLERLGADGVLRKGATESVDELHKGATETVDEVLLNPGDSASVDETRLTLRLGSRELARRSPSKVQGSVPFDIAERGVIGPRVESARAHAAETEPSRGFVPGPLARGPIGGRSAAPMAGEAPGRSARIAPRILAAPERDGGLRVRGRDRWILTSLFAAGRLGRRDLGRAALIYRNQRIAGRPRSVPEILSKERFLGREFEATLQEVESGWCFACTHCQRAYEPEGTTLLRARCPECDRRLACAPRSVNELATGARNPSRLNTRYDRLMPGTRLGDYKVQQLLGIGGYGAVYRAFDTRIRRTVALKVFPAGGEGEPEVLREARNVAAMPAHPHLVLVFHVGQALGLDYISYEYVSGHSLAYHIERRTSMDLEEKLRLLRDVLMGLGVAHENGVIHRDLKPDNILLVRREGRFRAKVTDFGLGMRLRRGQGAYHSRTVRGAPEYLAPEQFRTQTSSVASDLYSVGATFFHLLTGVPPFEGTTDQELAERHQLDPAPSIAEKLDDCPVSLERMLQRLLAKDPRERPSSTLVALDLLAEVEDEMRPARPRNSRLLVSGLVCLVLLLAGGLAWQTYGGVLGEWVSDDSDATGSDVAEARVGQVPAGPGVDRASPEAAASVTADEEPNPPGPTDDAAEEAGGVSAPAEQDAAEDSTGEPNGAEHAEPLEGASASDNSDTDPPESESELVEHADAATDADATALEADDAIDGATPDGAVAEQAADRRGPDVDGATGNGSNPSNSTENAAEAEVEAPPNERQIESSSDAEATSEVADPDVVPPGTDPALAPLLVAAEQSAQLLLREDVDALVAGREGVELVKAQNDLHLIRVLDVLFRDAVPVTDSPEFIARLGAGADRREHHLLLQSVALSRLMRFEPGPRRLESMPRVYDAASVTEWIAQVRASLLAHGIGDDVLAMRLPYREDLGRQEIRVLEQHVDEMEWFQGLNGQVHLYDRGLDLVRDDDLVRPSCFRLRLKVLRPDVLVQILEAAMANLRRTGP